MSHVAHTLEPEVVTSVRPALAGNQALVHDAHSIPTEEQVTRVVFFIVLAASLLFIAATLFVTHM